MDLSEIIAFAAESKTEITAGLGIFAFLLATWAKSKTVDIDQLATVNTVQNKAMLDLIEQNRQLAEEVHKLRNQVSESHKEVLALKTQIAELERNFCVNANDCDKPESYNGNPATA